MIMFHSAYIRRNCWVVNLSGKADGFVAIDLVQEHNIKDIKVSLDAFNIDD